MKKLHIFTGILTTIILATSMCCIVEYNKRDYIHIQAQHTYTCADITFSETVNNLGAYSDIDGSKIGTLTNLQQNDLSFKNWTNANYKQGVSTSAIKLGGSSTGKYAGSVTIASPTYVFDKVVIYASGWQGDKATQLVVNNISQDIPATAKGGDYNFIPYTFNLTSQTNTLIFANNPSASNKQRIVISKIVFRVYPSA